MKGGYDGMLNAGDIEFMDDSLDEIYTHRTRTINVIYLEKQFDLINGMPIGEQEVPREVDAVVTEISSMIPERTTEGGIKYIEGDVKFDVKIELIDDIIRKIERIEYDDDDFEITAIDKKGIGRRNRYEIVGRLMA